MGADTAPSGPRVDAARLFRAARRSRRLSQREFADVAGVPSTTVARTESGTNDPRFMTVVKVLAAVGYDVVVCDRWNRLLIVDEDRDRLMDRAVRHLPSHLRIEPTPHPHAATSRQWWGWHRIAWWPTDRVVPDHCYWRRREVPHLGDNSGLHEVWDDAT